MFGCCVAGRVLQTNLQQIDESHAYFELPAASTINHLCVFVTEPFPAGYGATVHFFWPGKGFQLLGMLSNEKPSAIFRLRGNFIQASSSTRDTAFSSASSGMQQDNDVTAVLGLAIEPLQQVQAEIARLPSAVAKPAHPDPTVLAERIVKNLFNYVSGFVGGTGGVTPELAGWGDRVFGKGGMSVVGWMCERSLPRICVLFIYHALNIIMYSTRNGTVHALSPRLVTRTLHAYAESPTNLLLHNSQSTSFELSLILGQHSLLGIQSQDYNEPVYYELHNNLVVK